MPTTETTRLHSIIRLLDDNKPYDPHDLYRNIERARVEFDKIKNSNTELLAALETIEHCVCLGLGSDNPKHHEAALQDALNTARGAIAKTNIG